MLSSRCHYSYQRRRKRDVAIFALCIIFSIYAVSSFAPCTSASRKRFTNIGWKSEIVQCFRSRHVVNSVARSCNVSSPVMSNMLGMQYDSVKKTMSGLLAVAALFTSMSIGSIPSFADEIGSSNAEIGACVLNSCRKELATCLLNPKCVANLICIQTCAGKPDETVCQIKCGDLFENEVVGKFNACAVSQKKCVPQKKDDNSYPVPQPSALVKKFDTNIFEGRWYISAGLNPIFDTFDCQVHFFTNPSPGQLYAKLNWRIKEPDGEFFNRDTVQRFIQDKDNPAILLNHDNEYLHYEDDWYILDAVPNSHVLVYYRGQNDAWKGYGGAVLYTRDKTVPKGIIPRVSAACERAGIKWSSFTLNDNSCKPQSRDAALLRAEYSKKLLLLEGNRLSEQLTAIRGYASSSLQGSEAEVESALTTLEKLRESYQNEIEFDALQLEDTLTQELSELKAGAKYEAELIKEEAELLKEEVKAIEDSFITSLDVNIWKVRESNILSRLMDKIESQ